MLKQRQDTAKAIGAQRAEAGASRVRVDEGSFLDQALDAAENGEQEALAKRQQGLDNAYNAELRAWGAGQDANMFSTRTSNVSPNASMNLGHTLIGGVKSLVRTATRD